MNAQDLLIKNGNWYFGRMISPSKTLYCDKYPTHDVCFNANIFNEKEKIWWGDIDLTLDSDFLQEVSDKSGETLYILREMDGRFENENIENDIVKNKAVKIFTPRHQKD